MIIGYEDLKRIREENKGKKIVMVKGTFDLFHLGHLNIIKRAREYGDMLLVLVKCDEAIKLKGQGRPIVDENQRAAIVDAIQYVDYTLIANKKIDVGLTGVSDDERIQYLRYYKIVSDLRPDVLIKPPKKLPEVLLKLYRELGTEIHEVEETPGISTTMLIQRIMNKIVEKT